MSAKKIAWWLLTISIALPLQAVLAQGTNIRLDGDIRVFSLLSALRVAGYNPPGLNLTGQRVLKEYSSLPPELRDKLRAYYQSHAQKQEPQDFINPYISLVLLSDGPPSFQLLIPLTNLPPDAKTAYDFLPLLRDFYKQAKVEAVWSSFRNDYDLAAIKTRPLIDQLILRTNGYLKISSYSYLDRQLSFIAEFLMPPNTLNARTYQDNYYLVFNPADTFKAEEVRHQYLHFLLDPFALRFTLPKETRMALVKFMETSPPIEDRYKDDSNFMFVESLIRALELRMNKVTEPKLTVALNQFVREGALFTRFFYDSLKEFETDPQGIRLVYPDWIRNLNFDEIKSQFTTALSAPVEKAIEPGAVEKLLKHAHLCMANDDLTNAREIYETILQKFDPQQGEALYGLGFISLTQKENPKQGQQLAKDYFQKAVESASCPNPSKVWAHIYLARIYDVEKNRDEAIRQYQAVLALGDNTRNAQEIAQKGVQEPFSRKQ
jgi:hypothetical protein